MRTAGLMILLTGWMSLASAQQYQVIATGFYNFENLFDTLSSYDAFYPERYINGEYPYIETIPAAPQGVDGYTMWKEEDLSAWLQHPTEDVPDTVYFDKRDDDFTWSGSLRNNGDVYYAKLGQLAKVVSGLATGVTPDGVALLGIAEIEQRKVLEDFVKQPALADRNYQIIHQNSMDFRGIDVALIYQPKYFTPEQYKVLPVKIYNDAGDREFTRDVLWVEGLLGGEKVHIFVNHWPSRRGGEQATVHKRAAAAQVCKDIIDSLKAIDPGVKVLVMGDLNDDPVSPSVVKVLQATGKKEAAGRFAMYNPFTEKFRKGNGTSAYRDAWSLFDQIILSPGWLDESSGYYFYKAEIYNKPFLIQKTGQYKGYPYRSFISGSFSGGYSDHFPVVAYFVKKAG